MIDYSQKDYSPFDHGTCTKETDDNFFLTDEQKKQAWDNFHDEEVNRLLAMDNTCPL